jgi:hypothetical protein
MAITDDLAKLGLVWGRLDSQPGFNHSWLSCSWDGEVYKGMGGRIVWSGLVWFGLGFFGGGMG